MKTNRAIAPGSVILLLIATLVSGQQAPSGGQPPPPGQPGPRSGPNQPPQGPPPDPMSENFFPPDQVMQHSRKLGLTEEQKNLIKAEALKAQARFTELQWQLHGDQETMLDLVKQDRVDEKEILTRLDRILNTESEIKRTHLALVVRIKNCLTVDQQSQLRELRKSMRPQPPGGPAMGGPPPSGFGPPPQ